MSESVTRDYSFTVRLSPEEKAALEALAARLELDKSGAVRHALSIASPTSHPLPIDGWFVPMNGKSAPLPIRLNKKEVHHDR